MNPPAPTSIIEKIKKLLRMKHGGTPAEIETALALARELAAKHGLELASINPDEHSAPRALSQVDALKSSRIHWECKYAALVVSTFFNVSFICRQPGYSDFRLTFYGAGSDLQVALYIYHFLVGHFRRSWPRARREHRLRNRQAFLYGMYHGLCEKLDQQRRAAVPQENALVLTNRELARREAYANEHWPKASSTSCAPAGDASLAKFLGFHAGQKTDLRPGLNPSAAHRPQLVS